jgi:hypothetical protein
MSSLSWATVEEGSVVSGTRTAGIAYGLVWDAPVPVLDDEDEDEDEDAAAEVAAEADVDEPSVDASSGWAAQPASVAMPNRAAAETWRMVRRAIGVSLVGGVWT